MGFVLEEIPEDYKKKYNLILPEIWQIDRARDAKFYMTGGNPRGPETSFDFIWKGKKLEAGGIFNSIGIGKTKIVEWNCVYIEIPKFLENERKKIIQALKEAFEGYGLAGEGALEKTMKVNFDKKMLINEDNS